MKKRSSGLSKLQIFTILKTTYFSNSEMTGDQLWLKLSESIYAAMKAEKEGGKNEVS